MLTNFKKYGIYNMLKGHSTDIPKMERIECIANEICSKFLKMRYIQIQDIHIAARM